MKNCYSIRNYVLLIGLYLLPSVMPAQSICFDPASDNRYETGSFPSATCTADFDNDGKPDVAVIRPGTVDVLMGNYTSTNTFDTKVSYPHNLSAGAIETADFNNDTKPDLVLFGTHGPDDVALFINNGNGTFATAIEFSFGTNNGSGMYNNDMRMSDFDGDGKKDLVINDKNLNRLYILKNNGNSTFTVTDTLLTGASPNSLAVGDLNNDGRDEIAVAYGPGASSNDSMSYFMNNGSGLFGNRTSIYVSSLTSNLRELAIAKLDNGTSGDILVDKTGGVAIYLNNGAQVFTAQPQANLGGISFQLVVADFNGDNKKDIASADYDNRRVNVVLGNGNGTFQGLNAYSANGRALHIIFADFDNDTRGDLITANNQTTGNISFLKGQADGSFGSYALRTAERPNAIAVGLVNNDAFEDLVVVHNQGRKVATMLGNSNGTFQNTLYDTCWQGMSSIELGDFNNDLKLDVVAIGNTCNILSGDNSGHFTILGSIASGFAGGGDYSSAQGDFNHDNNLDLIITYNNLDSFSVLLGNGDFTFDAPVKYYAGDLPMETIASDMNNDGNLDLLIANDQGNDVRILIGNANGTFQPGVSYATGASPRAVAAADFNKDGFKDFAAANGNGNNITVYLATGLNTFSSSVTYPLIGSSISATEMVAAYIDADTIFDLLITDAQNNTVILLQGNSNGTFQNAQSFAVETSPQEVVVADFNNDGANDFAAVNKESYNVTVVLNNNSYITTAGSPSFCVGDSVQLTASSGFSYEWSTGATTQSIYVSVTGSYSVSITNQSGSCNTVPPSVSVTSSTAPSVIFNTDNNGRKCVSDGSINLAGIGGQPQGGVYSGNFVSNGLLNATAAGAGPHVVTYTFTNGCGSDSESDTVFLDAEVLASISLPNDTFCVGGGTLTLSDYSSPAGGMWGVNNTIVTEVNLAQVPANTYLLHYAIEAGGCKDTAYVTVEVLDCTGIKEFNESALSVFPNPSNGNFVIRIENDSKYSLVRIVNAEGRIVAEKQLTTNQVSYSELPKGIYSVVLQNDKVQVSKRVIIH